MSKSRRAFCLGLIALLLASTINIDGQDLTATITIDIKDLATISVDGKFSTSIADTGRRNLSFVHSVGSVGGLGDRVSEVQLFDSAGNSVPYRRIAGGEYVSEVEFQRWTYNLDLRPRKETAAVAHVSWGTRDLAILMLGDLLPVSAPPSDGARITIVEKEPSGDVLASQIYTSEILTNGGYRIPDVRDAVFYVGSQWEISKLDSPPPGTLLISGKWNFDRSEFRSSATEIYRFYREIFGSSPAGEPVIAVTNFPSAVGLGQWEAETRGNSITIISSDMPFKTQSIQRLHEQLRHEVFHLWIPNGVDLAGNYDWFYEGFALYQSLRLAVGVNRITFADFLDTLSRAHTIDSAQTHTKSLIEASRSRFAGANTQIYARGMLVAFLTDLAMIESSRGNRSIEDLLRELYKKYRKPRATSVDGNQAVIDLLNKNSSVDQIVTKYVTGTEKIDWAKPLAVAGIEDIDAGPLTTLRVIKKLNGRQKTVLDKLGYNNWRRLRRDSK